MQLVIKDLSKTYRNGVRALNGVTLTIPTGMYGLLGPNGAGKSTLMRTIATLQDPDEGSITIGDLDVLKDKDQVRRVPRVPATRIRGLSQNLSPRHAGPYRNS
jgi:ABC-2 type transport system ATP-binding protein